MAEQTISPGVFTEENDQTFLAQGVNEIGGAFVGPTAKGPAFEPVEVTSPQDFERKFGNEGLYMDLSVRNYLRDASSATVVRLLGEDGYESESVEIQLPEGELSKRPFQISKFDFDLPLEVDVGQEIEFEVCVRGRQRRSTSDQILEYNLTIEEWIGGEYHKDVYAEGPLDKDCVVDSFTVATNEAEEVYYVVSIEAEDGSTDKRRTSSAEVNGFALSNVNYNWGSGETRGVGEILSLQGTVANYGGSEYSYQIYRQDSTGSIELVKEENGVLTEQFSAFFFHDGEAQDTLQYVVQVEQGEAEDVSDPSPAVEIIEREEPSGGFEVIESNFNIEAGDKVDFGDTIQIDVELTEGASVLEVNEVADGTSVSTGTGQDLTVPNDSSVYIETEVASSGVGLSTGDTVQYEVEIEASNGSTITTLTSPEVEIDQGPFQIEENNAGIEVGGEVDANEITGIEFTVENRGGGDFTYDVFEIVDDEKQTPAVLAAETGSADEIVESFAPTNASAGQELAYRVEVSQSDTQGQSIASSDSFTTPTVDVIDRDPAGEFAIQDVDFNFGAGTVEAGETLFTSFQVDLDGAADYEYKLVVIRNGEELEGTAAVQATGVTETEVFESFKFGDSGATLFEGDSVVYRLYAIDTANGVVRTVDSPELVFTGDNLNANDLLFEQVDFQFADGSTIERNERLGAFFDVYVPSDVAGYRYEVVRTSDGAVVTDTVQEEGQNFISVIDPDPDAGDIDRIELGWQADEDYLMPGMEESYEIRVIETTATGDDVGSAITEESGTVTVTERIPSTPFTLADLAPTQRLRREGLRIDDAQINPNKADIRDFELILSTAANTAGASDVSGEIEKHEPENEVAEAFAQNDITEPGDLEIDLIEGRSYDLSLMEGASNYLLDFFGTDPEGVREVFAKTRFPEAYKDLIENHLTEDGASMMGAHPVLDEINLQASYQPVGLDFEDQGYDHAVTPPIVSQDLQPQKEGANRQNLFQIETLSDGETANTEIKISIRNVRYPREVSGSNYGEFDVVVREFGDSDTNPDIIESFTGVNLDPESPNYIAKIIGNQETVFTENGKLVSKGGESGVFENRSDYIRVKVNPEVVKANEGGKDGLSQLVPWGFGQYTVPTELEGDLPHGLKVRQFRSVADAEYDILPDGRLEPDLTTVDGPFEPAIHFGVDTGFEGNESHLQAVSQEAPGEGRDDQSFQFVLSDAYVQDGPGGIRKVEYGDGDAEGFPVSARKFTVAFQGGFGGKDPAKPQAIEEDITATNTQGFDVSGPESPGTLAYKKAIGILGNTDYFDINLLVTPGIINDLHSPVVQSGINMVEQRADTFYVFDPVGVNDSIDDAVASVNGIDTSYAATYYPWLRIRDQTRNRQVRVPPSVLIPRVYAFNDQNAAEWFAPAGFERGGIPEAIAAVRRLRREDRDSLYANNVNPIAQFPDQGVSVWGQKTLQTQASALDRVNVRRLLIRVKKFIASTSRFLVFEQNVPATRQRFKNLVNPFLDQVQQQNGLFAFRVKMDADNNPSEVIDRNELVGEIFLQPTRTAEFIRLTFNVLPTGASFEDL